MKTARSTVSLVALLVLFSGAAASPSAFARAQNGAATAEPVDNAKLLEDWIHYVQTANYPMAESVAAELMAQGLSNKDFSSLVEAGDIRRFESATQRALRIGGNEGLQRTAAQLLSSYEKGRLERARDPEQIARNIRNLTGNLRARLLAREGLVQAGEYAMPQLLEAYLQPADPALSVQAQTVIIDLGRHAIVPLMTGLPRMQPAAQEKVARVLGLIPYKMSLPVLTDVMATAQTQGVRSACEAAINQLGGNAGPAHDLYRFLAESYFNEKSEVTNFPGEEYQLLWAYDPASGLAMNAIRTEVFHEAMAMRHTERAMQLELDNSGSINTESLALWTSANYSREFDTPEGYVNPAYPTAALHEEGQTPRRGAEYFGIAGGPTVAQRVLQRALNDRDISLARRAIGAIEATAGGKAVLESVGGRSALGQALVFPNRRVQLDAALAVAAARPQSAFPGSERVVATLASAVRGSGAQYATVLTPDTERYQAIRASLEKSGFTVLPQGSSLTAIEGPLGEAPAVDLVVISGFSGERTSANLDEVKGFPKTTASPVLMIVSPETYAESQRRFEADRSVAVRPAGLGESQLQASVGDLVNRTTGGPIKDDEAEIYTARSLGALRDLAVSGNQVMNVGDAAGVLIGALQDDAFAHKGAVAAVLAMIGQDRAQRALMDAAAAAEGPERAVMLAQVADSAKRFGNMLEARQLEQLAEIAASEDEATATAGAAALGALNVPNRNLLPMILGSK
ncbi:MAG TPA: hypothetical protein VD971_09860 [Phycisphaerales bacterium]|nr:hypothetical protein [Phycisphaerales bacterium]